MNDKISTGTTWTSGNVLGTVTGTNTITPGTGYVSVSFETVETKKKKEKNYNFPGVIKDKNGNIVYIKKVIYNNPATIVFWSDKTKTTCKAIENDTYNEEAGLSICILKKILGTDEVVSILNYWIDEQTSLSTKTVDLKQVMKKCKK